MGEVSSDSSSENPPSSEDKYADYTYRESGGFAKFGYSLLTLTVLAGVGFGVFKVSKM